MYYYPASSTTANWYRIPKANSYIRLFNASPNSPSVDVYANDSLIISNLAYKQFSQYFPLVSGNYKIKVYPTGQKTNPIIDTDVYLPEYSVFNLTIIGVFPNVSLYTIPEPTTPQNFGRPCIRFINLSPNESAVNITLSDGTKVFNNVGYKYISDYACIPDGTYTFEIISANSNNVILTIPNVQLLPNTYYTIYLVGFAGGTPSLEALVVPEPR